MKRLVFCFDGSWNKLDTPHPTNVLLTAESVQPRADDGVTQMTFYDEGVGTAAGEGITGGVFGAGLVRNLGDGYRSLIFNYAPGDEIYVFGFSRGAYTARSFVGLLNTCGVLHRQEARRANQAVELYKRRNASEDFQEEVLRFRSAYSPQIVLSEQEDRWRARNVPDYVVGMRPILKVNYLGVWDTVGALGIPRYIILADTINRMHQFHDVSLSRMVDSARHAVAIDEHKVDFEPTLWENLDALNEAKGFDYKRSDAPYQQRWFPGGHGSVGGGGARRGLSDLALEWIWDGARLAGLDLDTSPGSHLARLAPTHREKLSNGDPTPGFDPIGFILARLPTADRTPGPKHLYEVSPMARHRWKESAENLPEAAPYRPKTLEPLAGELDALDLFEDDSPGDDFVIYVVRKGDTLESIAEEAYGSADKAVRLFRANRNKLADPDDIHPGLVLRLPREP